MEQHKLFAELKSSFLSYINDRIYMCFLIITAIGSYGFLITHYSISIDDLEYGRYYFGELIAQGRLTATVFHRFFELTDNFIWIQDFWGMIFLCLGVILLCIAFDRVSQNISRAAKIVFSCLFVSYPLHSEIFVYNGCFVAIGLGLTLIALALISMTYYQDLKKIRFMVLAAAFILPVASWYESVMIIYVSAVFGILIIEQLDNNSSSADMPKLIRKGLGYACPFLAAFVIEAVASNLIRLLLKIEPSTNAYNQIIFIQKKLSLSEFEYYCGLTLNTFIKSFLNYFPVRIFVVSILILFCLAIVKAIKLKKFGIAFCGAGLILSNFAIWILTSGIIYYRTCTSYAFLVAFTAFIVLYGCNHPSERKIASRVIAVLCTVLIFAQINTINYYFTNDYLRYEYEKKVLSEVGNELQNNYDLDKNVVFAGKNELPQSIKNRFEKDYNTVLYNVLIRIPVVKKCILSLVPDPNVKERVQQINMNYVYWAINNAFDQESMIAFFEFLGFDGIKKGSAEQIEAAKESAEDMPAWPAEGSIIDNGDYIIVKF